MNYLVASSILTLYDQLRQEVEQRLPQEIEEGKTYWDGKPIKYSLSKINFETMNAIYSRYIGCGDYEERERSFNLDELFD